MSVIKVENLTKYYGKTLAVDKVSFSIEKGEIVGFVGKNGAGKSTTIRCLMNFIAPISGKCEINDIDCQSSSKLIRDVASYMPSDSMFVGSATGKDVLSLCLKFSTKSAEDVENLASYFELDLTKKISDLSLGNRKKVSIIATLLNETDVLILDEPTSGLDPLMQERFFDLLLTQRKQGKTIFLSSHNLSEIQRYCDRAIIIKDGKIVDEVDMNSLTLTQKQMVSYTTTDGKSVSFENDKSINELIKSLSKLDLASLEIKSKSVEDEFIKYYKEGEKDA